MRVKHSMAHYMNKPFQHPQSTKVYNDNDSNNADDDNKAHPPV